LPSSLICFTVLILFHFIMCSFPAFGLSFSLLILYCHCTHKSIDKTAKLCIRCQYNLTNLTKAVVFDHVQS
jgi:hypothetical protein